MVKKTPLLDKMKPLTRSQRRKLHAIQAVERTRQNSSMSFYVHNRGKAVELPMQLLMNLLECAYSAGSQYEIERMRAMLNEP
jgi:hypothetical protein